MNNPIKYRIYPSVLNNYQRLLDTDVDAEDFSNIDSDSGDYRRSPEEIFAEREQALLDLINRTPHLPIEAADRGTAFNDIVDCILLNRPCQKENIQIASRTKVNDVELPHIEALINGFVFRYETDLCKETAKAMAGGIPQYRCRGTISTAYGEVELYGDADYVFPNKVVDLKTCGRYDFGKYSHNWQKVLYPYCLVQSGDMKECEMFEFYVVQLKDPTKAHPVLSGTIYREDYTYIHEKATADLRNITERLIEWLEANREKITNMKIFGA